MKHFYFKSSFVSKFKSKESLEDMCESEKRVEGYSLENCKGPLEPKNPSIQKKGYSKPLKFVNYL